MTDQIASLRRHNRQPALNRREFLGGLGAATALAALGWTSQTRAGEGTPAASKFPIGACTAYTNWETVQRAGGAYVEESFSRLLNPKLTDQEFAKHIEPFRAAKAPAPACNSFLPGELKLVGPNPNHDEIVAYATKGFERAKALGIGIIVLGSGGSRKVPEGFEQAKAEAQFVEVVKRLARAAQPHNVVVAMEPLNRSETNFANRLTDCVRLARAVDHPHFKLVADFYHMLREEEGAEALEAAGPLVVHCHIAEKANRTPPGQHQDDFRPFLRVLSKSNYQGRISLECRWKDFHAEVAPAIAALKNQASTI